MPIYEYRCTACGRTIEMLQSVDDPPATECNHCPGRLEKLFSAPSFQFKGSGWYVTDYGKGGSAGSGGEADKSAPAASDTGGASAETNAKASKSTDSSAASASSGSSSAES